MKNQLMEQRNWATGAVAGQTCINWNDRARTGLLQQLTTATEVITLIVGCFARPASLVVASSPAADVLAHVCSTISKQTIYIIIEC